MSKFASCKDDLRKGLRIMLRKDNDSANPLLWIIFLVALYISAFFLEIPKVELPGIIYFGSLFDTTSVFSQSTLSIILAAAFLLMTAMAVHVLNDEFSNGLNFILPLLFLILVVDNPQVLFFTPFHIAALLLMISMAYFVRFKAESLSYMDLFTSYLMLVISSCVFPPLIWLTPFMFLSGTGVSEGGFKYLVVTLCSLISGAGLVMGLAYLFSGFDAMMAIPQSYLGAITDWGLMKVNLTWLHIGRDAILALLIITAVIRNLRNQGKYKIAESKMLSTMTLFTVLLSAIMVLFVKDISLPFGIVLLAPASLVIFGLFGDSKKTLATIFIIIITAITVAERYLVIKGIPSPLIDTMTIL